MTIVISSHLLGLVQPISTASPVPQGRIGLVGKVDDLARQVLAATVVAVEADDVDSPPSFPASPGWRVTPAGNGVTASTPIATCGRTSPVASSAPAALRDMAIRRAASRRSMCAISRAANAA
jgi:hypothetical protein